MLTAFPAFPLLNNDIEAHTENISKCRFSFPGEPGCPYKKPCLSKEARELIVGLVKPESNQRLSIQKIKRTAFFVKFVKSWAAVESGALASPGVIPSRSPTDRLAFDNIDYDSDDMDFEHEYLEIEQKYGFDLGTPDPSLAGFGGDPCD